MAHRALNPRDREYFLPESFWPIQLEVPARPPLLVHLDIAQWIRFGRVRQGNGEPAYVELLEA